MTLNDHIVAQPLWLQSWVIWMGVINVIAVLFLVGWKDGRPKFGHIEAVVIITCLFAMAPSMDWLFGQVGYVRLLGLVHVVFWTPLVVYLWRRLPLHPRKTIFGIYLRVLVATIVASLIIDYIDVARYLLGDGTLT